MQVTARHKFLRSSPRKLRLLTNDLRGRRVGDVLAELRLRPQAGTLPLGKLLRSAVANAEHNYSLDPNTLVIDQITADSGPVLKRYQPRAQGRAYEVRRPSTHLTVVIRDVPIPKPDGSPVKRVVKKVAPKRAKTAKPDKDAPKDETKPDKAPKDRQASTSEDNQPGAKAAPQRTAQQTGRGSTTRAAKRTGRRGDKS